MQRILASFFALNGLCVSARAQGEYPTRPITLVVPYAAGGPSDVIARLTGQSMTATLGQQIVIENVAGAGGTTGAVRVADARVCHRDAVPVVPDPGKRLSDGVRWEPELADQHERAVVDEADRLECLQCRVAEVAI